MHFLFKPSTFHCCLHFLLRSHIRSSYHPTVWDCLSNLFDHFQSSKVPKIKDNTLAKADSMAPAMLRRYKIHPFRKALRPEAEARRMFRMKKPWLWKILEKFSARFMFFLRITAGMCLGTMRSILQIQKLEVSKFGNPMKRSHAEMATDMWEILGFKRALSIFPEPRHPKAFKQRWNNTFPPKVGVMITIIISFIIITNIVHPFSIPPGPFSCQKLLRSQWIRYSGLLSRCCAPHIHPTRLPQNQMSGWCIAKALRVPNGGGMI